MAGVVLLLLEATVVLVPETGVVVVLAAVVVPEVVPEDVVLVLAVVPEAGAVVVTPEGVPDATVAALDAPPAFATVAGVAVVSFPCERSTMPTLEDTGLAAASDAVEAVAALLDPSSPPQAARVSVAKVHRTTLRI